MNNKTKKCGNCGKELPLTAYNKSNANRDGLQHRCKECCRKYNKQYKLDNPEYGKAWFKSNPNYQKEWRKSNPEYYNEYYASNKERYKGYNKKKKTQTT